VAWAAPAVLAEPEVTALAVSVRALSVVLLVPGAPAALLAPVVWRVLLVPEAP